MGKKVYFGNSGAEALEAASKLARWHTERDLNIAFLGAFHRRTIGALSLTASKLIQKKHYNPLIPGITHIPFPNCYRCPWGMCAPECGMSCAHFVEDTLFRTSVPPEEVTAIIVKPIQGEGEYIIPTSNFHFFFHPKPPTKNESQRYYQNPIYVAKDYKRMIEKGEVKNQSAIAEILMFPVYVSVKFLVCSNLMMN
jgi:hypothetical protein